MATLTREENVENGGTQKQADPPNTTGPIGPGIGGGPPHVHSVAPHDAPHGQCRALSVAQEDLANLFTYHSTDVDQARRYEQLRGRGLQLAQLIVELCPDSRERSLAITKLRETIMFANASIACNT